MTSKVLTTDALGFVPVGAEHALSAREIWKIADVWAEATFATKLNKLANAGEIERREQPIPSGFKFVYWRAAA